MAKQKKLEGILEAVAGIVGTSATKKKLKKKKALKSFIAKMNAKQEELSAELKQDDLKKDREKLVVRHIETLTEQIAKAEGILKSM